jgi:MFS family permease
MVEMSLTRTQPDEQSEIQAEDRDAQPPVTGAVAQRESAPDAAKRAAPPRPRLTRALIRSLTAIIIGSLILRLASQTTGQMLQFYFSHIDRHYYHLSHTLTGFITASFFITELFGSLILGAMSDRYGRRLFILLGPVFGLIAVQMTAMTVVLWLLVITRLLEGLSTASSVPATLGYISEATVGRPALRARVIGLFEITLVGGIALGASVGGYLWRFFGHRATVLGVDLTSPAFAINGLIYLVSLFVFAWGLKDLKRQPGLLAGAHGKLQHYRAILRSRAVWLFIPAWLAIFSIIGVWINNSIRLLTGDERGEGQLLMGHVSTVQFGNGLAALAIIFAAGILVWSFILARYRKTSVMLIAVGGLFILLGTVYGLNHLGSFANPLYYPLMGLLLLGVVLLSGFTPAALTYLADVTECYAEDRGSIMGLYSVFLGVGQLLGAVTGGYFAEQRGIDGLLELSAAFGIITLLSLLLLRRKHPQEATRAANPLPTSGAR